MADITWNEVKFPFAVVYGPADSQEKTLFFTQLKNIDFPPETIFVGDFNSWTFPADKAPEMPLPEHAILFGEWQQYNCLKDTADFEAGYPAIMTRINSANLKDFSATRLDYILAGPALPLAATPILPSNILDFDHRYISTKFEIDGQSPRDRSTRLLPLDAGHKSIAMEIRQSISRSTDIGLSQTWIDIKSNVKRKIRGHLAKLA